MTPTTNASASSVVVDLTASNTIVFNARCPRDEFELRVDHFEQRGLRRSKIAVDHAVTGSLETIIDLLESEQALVRAHTSAHRRRRDVVECVLDRGEDSRSAQSEHVGAYGAGLVVRVLGEIPNNFTFEDHLQVRGNKANARITPLKRKDAPAVLDGRAFGACARGERFAEVRHLDTLASCTEAAS